MTISIQHQPATRRFTTTVDGQVGYVEYSQEGDVLAIDHTIVPAAIGGRGIAGDLVKAALEHARSSGLRVRPSCSYADGYMKRHPEFDHLRA